MQQLLVAAALLQNLLVEREILEHLAAAPNHAGKRVLDLGYGLARFHGEVDEGLRLCRRAVEIELYQPENHYYLAATYLLAGDRRSAIDALEQGLQVDATHAGLKELMADLGRRRSPMLPFLPRRHVLNRWLGKVRHRLFGPRKSG